MTARMSSLDAFTTPRMRAERLRPDHWADLRRMDTDEQMMAMLGGVRDEVGTADYLARNLKHWAERGFGLWMLRDFQTNTMIGRAVLRHLEIDDVDEVEVGYGFLPDYWGRGLATEIALTCVRLGLEELRLRSLVAITLTTNRGSRRVLEKAGLVYERDVLHAGLSHALFRIVNQGVVR
ncbi:MAG TPA: GNAT family N-acetyltransferase [Gemmatimonadales bacterium]|nr:GNAT family N-acetyltransferase [Gemmatimonadales bacterium]